MFFAGQNVIFIHVPKTGGNYFAKAFVGQSSDRLTVAGHQDGVDRFELLGEATRSKHQDLRQYHAILAGRLASCRVWATYRDPVERMVSLYFSPHRWMKQQADGHFAAPPDASVPFDLDDFAKVISNARSTWQLLDCDNMTRLPSGSAGSGMAGLHKSGAAVHLFDFADLHAQFAAFAVKEGFLPPTFPDRVINPSTVNRDRAQSLCRRLDIVDLVLASHHGQDRQLVGAM